jgi:hypothetical protein
MTMAGTHTSEGALDNGRLTAHIRRPDVFLTHDWSTRT